MTDTPSLTADHTTTLPDSEDSSYARIAEAVEVLTCSYYHLHNELGAQSQHVQETFLLEDGLLQATNIMHIKDNGLQFLQDKIEDLENLFQRSNLHIIGLLESIKLNTLMPRTRGQILLLCSTTILLSLGIGTSCTVDKQLILQSYRQQHDLQVDGDKPLLFADFSVQVSRKCKATSH